MEEWDDIEWIIKEYTIYDCIQTAVIKVKRSVMREALSEARSGAGYVLISNR